MLSFLSSLFFFVFFLIIVYILVPIPYESVIGFANPAQSWLGFEVFCRAQMQDIKLNLNGQNCTSCANLILNCFFFLIIYWYRNHTFLLLINNFRSIASVCMSFVCCWQIEDYFVFLYKCAIRIEFNIIYLDRIAL